MRLGSVATNSVNFDSSNSHAADTKLPEYLFAVLIIVGIGALVAISMTAGPGHTVGMSSGHTQWLHLVDPAHQMTYVQTQILEVVGSFVGGSLLVGGLAWALKPKKEAENSLKNQREKPSIPVDPQETSAFLRATEQGSYRANTTNINSNKYQYYLTKDVMEGPLPDNLSDICSAPCPFGDGNVTVGETHALVYVPENLTAQDYNRWVDLSPRRFGGYPVQLRPGAVLPGTTLEGAYWALIPKACIPGMRDKGVKEQDAILEAKGYERATVTEVIVLGTMECMASGDMLFSGGVMCADQGEKGARSIIKGYHKNYELSFEAENSNSYGVAAVRRLPIGKN